MINYLSCDFESWVYPDLPEFRKLTSSERKRLDNGHVEKSGELILDLLAKYKVKITFFVLGQLYEWYPKTIERIAQEGHEVAFHTYSHDILRSKEVLVDSLEKSKKFLNKFKPKGFRAPNMFIKKEYFPILQDYGFQYDSSIYASDISNNLALGLVELPVSTFCRLPVGSGYFIALFGKKSAGFYRQINKRNKSVVAFIHNWQILKPSKASFPGKDYLLKHPYYLPYTFEVKDTFEYLLNNFNFRPMVDFVKTKK